MDEKRANIDLAFRNGLKDYEVLPPPDVWNCIDSRLVRKVRPVYYARAAAFLALALSLSVLAYKWSATKAPVPGSDIIALNEESSRLYGTILKAPVLRETPRQGRSTTARLAIPVSTAALQEETLPAHSEETQPAHREETISLLSLPAAELIIPQKTSSLAGITRQSVYIAAVNPAPVSLTAEAAKTDYLDYLSSDLPDANTAAGSPRWSVSALASPTYNGKFNTTSSELAKQLAGSEDASMSYTGGLTVSYKLNRRLSIQSGLFYSSVGQEINGINSFAGFRKYDYTKGANNFQVITTTGTITTTNADVFLFADGTSERLITAYNRDVFDPQKASLDYISNTMKQSYSYLELPVFLRYKVIDRTVDFNLIGGLSYNLLVNNSVYTVVEGSKYLIGTTEGLNTFAVSSSFGMGMEYKFSEKLSLNLEPTFRYYLNTLGNSAGSQYHPYSFGVFSGISYRF